MITTAKASMAAFGISLATTGGLVAQHDTVDHYTIDVSARG